MESIITTTTKKNDVFSDSLQDTQKIGKHLNYNTQNIRKRQIVKCWICKLLYDSPDNQTHVQYLGFKKNTNKWYLWLKFESIKYQKQIKAKQHLLKKGERNEI